MGNVYITLDEEHEIFLRQQVQEKYGSKKGSISTVIQQALDELREKEKKEQIRKQFFQTIDKGINLGFKGKAYTSRDEIYD
ncbi:MAG: hypothetical protein AABX38_02355 [Candidatus Micrarchaeota archaeon]